MQRATSAVATAQTGYARGAAAPRPAAMCAGSTKIAAPIVMLKMAAASPRTPMTRRSEVTSPRYRKGVSLAVGDLLPDLEVVTDPAPPPPPDPETTLVNPAATGVRTTPPSGTSLPFKDRLQQALGREYETIALTGQGGFARVYRAQDKRLDRMVAIKVLKPELLETPEIVERFRAEGVALAK